MADLRPHAHDHDGAACACCGEATPEFLQVVPVDNEGVDRTLCSNCYCARLRHGECPHERVRMEAALMAAAVDFLNQDAPRAF